MKALYFENDLLRIMALKATSKLNRLAALGPFSPLRYEEVPEPSLPNQRWIKVRNQACGLCEPTSTSCSWRWTPSPSLLLCRASRRSTWDTNLWDG
jgi:hypothetical protein